MASLSQGRTAAAQCGLFTHKSVPVIFEPPCISVGLQNEFGTHIRVSDYKQSISRWYFGHWIIVWSYNTTTFRTLNFSLFSVEKERGRTYSWGFLERTIFHSLSKGFYEQCCLSVLSTWWRKYFQSPNRGGLNLTLIMPNTAVTSTETQNSLNLNY